MSHLPAVTSGAAIGYRARVSRPTPNPWSTVCRNWPDARDRPQSMRHRAHRALPIRRSPRRNMGMSYARPADDTRVRSSIDVLLITAFFLQIADEYRSLFRAAHAVLGDDIDKSNLDVLGHALSVAADVDVRAVGEPRPQIAADFAHAVLHVDFLAPVARPGEREPGQNAGRLHALELVLIEEIEIRALMAEEQPIAAGCLRCPTLLKKGAEWRNAGAWPDHDDRHARIGRQRESVRFLHVNLDGRAGFDTLGEVGGGHADPAAIAYIVAHCVDRQRDP